nr:PREDICTED: uncharacterized protein LOC103313664 isoform X2 [Tribolium castaneum]XP_015837690.1 PREDICTED: uncharacterized protein LOC103313664 isoform X2 [Tribolium castaneum]|eukprot:XP_008196041.2 PREDICTED: uncharacterized protein LOC103313664 isoform X2 [Tribolium castaneum]
MNCKNNCNAKCEKCDPQKGCIKCKTRYLYKNNKCSEKLPVVLEAPTLLSITENSLHIALNLTYDMENEAKPEFYQIQYKRIGDENYFKNYSEPKSFSNSSKGNCIIWMDTVKWNYQIRIVLSTVNNQSFLENIPELKTFKKSLNVTGDKDLTLAWIPYMNITSYVLKYEWSDGFCSTSDKKHNFITTNNRSATTSIPLNYKSVNIKLFGNSKKNNKIQLLDEITYTNINVKEELPQTEKISLTKDSIVVILEDCQYFGGPLKYNITYKCLSKWCSNNSARSEIVEVNYYNKTITQKLQGLMPYTNYSLNLTAIRGCNTKATKEFFKKTTPTRPKTVENLTADCTIDRTIQLKWKESYPPTGLVERYNILYKEKNGKKEYSNLTLPCSLWDNFVCAKITNLKKESEYTIEVQVKNANVSQWSEPNKVKCETRKKFFKDRSVDGNMTLILILEGKTMVTALITVIILLILVTILLLYRTIYIDQIHLTSKTFKDAKEQKKI